MSAQKLTVMEQRYSITWQDTIPYRRVIEIAGDGIIDYKPGQASSYSGAVTIAKSRQLSSSIPPRTGNQ
jgi:hypothetical protein